MSDIVEQLLHPAFTDGVRKEAAAEIGRLRRLCDQYDQVDIDRIKEIERLSARNAELLVMLKEYVRDYGDNEDLDSQCMAAKANALIAKAEGK